MSILEKIEKSLDKAPPNDDIQRKLETTPFMKEYKNKIAFSAVSILLAFIGLLAFYLMAKNMRPPNLVLASYQKVPATSTTPASGSWVKANYTPMILPNQSQSTVKSWARETVQKVYSFDFKNVDTQLSGAEKYFTPEGWVAFKNVLRHSQLFKTVEENKLSVAVTPTAEPIVDNAASRQGTGEYAWRVFCPVLISFSGDTPTKSIPMVITVNIIRVPTSENPKGLGVQQLFANPAPQEKR